MTASALGLRGGARLEAGAADRGCFRLALLLAGDGLGAAVAAGVSSRGSSLTSRDSSPSGVLPGSAAQRPAADGSGSALWESEWLASAQPASDARTKPLRAAPRCQRRRALLASKTTSVVMLTGPVLLGLSITGYRAERFVREPW